MTELEKQLLEALKNVDVENQLRARQRVLEERRQWGCSGIAVNGDELALAWQELDEPLQALRRARYAAIGIAISRGPSQPAPAVPDGWQLVPIEPTEAMKYASYTVSYRDEGREHWHAMLAAAPNLTRK